MTRLLWAALPLALAACGPSVLATSPTGITIEAGGANLQAAEDIAAKHCAPGVARQVSVMPVGYGYRDMRYECDK